MTAVSTFRLYLLRAVYLLFVFGTGSLCWPALVDPTRHWEFFHGVVLCMLAAFSGLSALGVRYPLKMLPLLFWEFGWKAIWLLRIAVPAWQSGHMDQDTADNVVACLVVVVVPIAMPWRYFMAEFLRAPADPWRTPSERPHSS